MVASRVGRTSHFSEKFYIAKIIFELDHLPNAI